jgi:hypothetical protein
MLISTFTTQHVKVGVFAAALIFGAAMVGQAISTTFRVIAAPLKNLSPLRDVRKNDPNELALEDIKARLVGSCSNRHGRQRQAVQTVVRIPPARLAAASPQYKLPVGLDCA